MREEVFIVVYTMEQANAQFVPTEHVANIYRVRDKDSGMY